MELLLPLLRAPHPADARGNLPDPVQRTFADITRNLCPDERAERTRDEQRGQARPLDRVADLQRVEVPTLVIGARYDTMDPAHMEMIAGLLPHGRYLFRPKGSHLAIYDDQETYFAADRLSSRPANAGCVDDTARNRRPGIVTSRRPARPSPSLSRDHPAAQTLPVAALASTRAVGATRWTGA